MVSERDAKGGNPLEASPPFRCLQPRRPTMGLADSVALPAPFLHSLAKVRCVACAVPSFRSAPEALSWGPAGTAKARYVAFQLRPSLPAPSVIEPRLASPACEPPRRYSKCYAGDAMSRGTRKAAIEPASRRAERLGRACSSTPASAALEAMSRVALRVWPDGHWLKVTNPAAPSARGKQKQDCSPRTRGLASLLLLRLRAQLRHLRSGGCLNVALVTGP